MTMEQPTRSAVLSPSAALDRWVEAEVRYFASGGADVPPFEEMLDPDFVLVEPASLPYGGEWRGPDGFLRFLETMNRVWSRMGPKDPPVHVEQGDTIVLLATLDAVGRATGRAIEVPVAQVVRFRAGLLLEARMFYFDTVAVNEALGHDPR
ncbi:MULTISPECIES: nuclear transport factor 2 family protein [Actinomadura]|uniref:Nuclear transport factor 2 family protein n=2 Tax=Actinomadura yumaensis TaxID=111807 RepID=A0ABW2CPJ0_9ACTN|nr:nuclear transport factor 2 family protein [Actinomadura sp. J1-007]MWK36840.1 DUF4440 domain-containing protein [Actinomadura sp. J1-007]